MKKIVVNVSTPATRLFVGSIAKDKSREDFLAEFEKIGGTNVSFIQTLITLKIRRFRTEHIDDFCSACSKLQIPSILSVKILPILEDLEL